MNYIQKYKSQTIDKNGRAVKNPAAASPNPIHQDEY